MCAILTNKNEFTPFQLFVMQMLNALLPTTISCWLSLFIAHALLTYSNKRWNIDYVFSQTNKIHIPFCFTHGILFKWQIWFECTHILCAIENHVADSKCLIFYFMILAFAQKVTPSLNHSAHTKLKLDPWNWCSVTHELEIYEFPPHKLTHST